MVEENVFLELIEQQEEGLTARKGTKNLEGGFSPAQHLSFWVLPPFLVVEGVDVGLGVGRVGTFWEDFLE